MSYGFLADCVVTAHLLFILFVVFGAWLGLRWPRVLWIHAPAFVWGAATEFFGIVCPLTYLENYLRIKDASSAYTSGFIEQYLVPFVYPTALTREIQWLLGALLLVVNAAIYAYLWRRSNHASSSNCH